MADAATGAAGVIRVDVSVASSAPGNYSNVSWAFYLLEASEYNFSFSGGTSASVDRVGVATLWSGSFAWDWRSGGIQNTLIASGTTRVNHNSDGTSPGCTIQGNMGATGTSGAGGPTSVAQGASLPTLKVVPNTPTGLTATRISDTQVSLSWSQTNASNGAPTGVLVQNRVNDGAWTDLVNLGNTTTATVSTAADRKTEYRVRSSNAAGTTAFSNISSPVYTTPDAPSSVVAAKDASLNIVVTFTENVDYAEHTHEVWHGTVTGGVTTWDGAALSTLASGVTTYTHVAPNASQVHTYRVRAVTGALTSAYSQSGNVQLLVAPNAPTIPAMPAFADKASIYTFSWLHNPIDTTAQTAYEFQYSTNGGSSWSGTGKVVSGSQSATRPANTYAANVVLTMRVRTWGQATTGGADGTGASAWSDLKTVTFKTVPTTSVTAPANGGTINDATVRADISFAQAEAATFVKAELELKQGATLLETLESTIRVGITFATLAANGTSYTVRARVQDSNGLWSAWATSTFNVVYLSPVAAGVTTEYLPDTGFGQVNISIAAPGGGESAAVTLSVTRAINGGTPEPLVTDYPVASLLAFLDTTAVINGTNTYRVTTTSALGATRTVTVDLVTAELRRAFLGKGASFQNVGTFGGNLSVDESLDVASATVQAAGRIKPIGLYGTETSVQLKVSSRIVETFGSTPDQMRQLLLVPGKACYRDPSGRRVFGTVKGGLSYDKGDRADLNFTLTETS